MHVYLPVHVNSRPPRTAVRASVTQPSTTRLPKPSCCARCSFVHFICAFVLCLVMLVCLYVGLCVSSCFGCLFAYLDLCLTLGLCLSFPRMHSVAHTHTHTHTHTNSARMHIDTKCWHLHNNIVHDVFTIHRIDHEAHCHAHAQQTCVFCVREPFILYTRRVYRCVRVVIYV